MNVNLKEHYGLYTGGKFVPASDGKEFETTNPATGDGMNVALSVALCLAAAIGMAGVAITRKKF